MQRAGKLKPMLVEFAMSPLFDRELSEVIAREFPGDVVTDESAFSMVLDNFVLQHRLRSGTTVIEAFVAAHPELTEPDRDLLLGWQDVVEGAFEVTGKDRDALILFNLMDELTYRARSNLGPRAFRPLKKRMIVIGRLVPLGDDWMVSGNPAAFPAAVREMMLVAAAKQALAHPEAVFRNPAKLAEARRMTAEHHRMFVDLFGTDLVVVPSHELPGKVDEYHRYLARDMPGGESSDPPPMDFPEDLLDAGSVAVHFVSGVGMTFYPGYDLIEAVFGNPALLSRRRYRDTLSSFLRDPDVSPEPLRRLAARDPAKANAVFAKLLNRKRGFSWDRDGEQLLRQHKPSYFDGTVLPRTVALSEPLASALKRAKGLS
jgi:hypothetical protein